MRTLYINKSRGFTVTELLVVVTVLSLLTGVVLQVLGGFYGESITSLGKTSQDTQTRGVLREIEKDISIAYGFKTEINPLARPLGRNDGTSWSYLGNVTSQPGYDNAQKTNRVLIATSTATDRAVTAANRLPVFTNSGAGCSNDPTTSPVAQNALVYFVAKNTKTGKYDLYRRTITNISGGTLCGSIYQKTSCSPTIIASGTYSSICKAVDADLLYDIDSFTVDYYTSADDPDSSSITDQYTTDPTKKAAVEAKIQAAKAIKITVNTDNFINGKHEKNTASIRISLAY